MFALEGDAYFAILNSCFHTEWAEKTSSRLKEDPNYNLAKTFETFPLPEPTPELNGLGRSLHEHRHILFKRWQEGLTSIYNRFHDPYEAAADIQTLRNFHVEMDKAVADAYGWSDLDLGHGFHETKQGTRFTISEAARREVLARLLKLNHERYAEEVAQGLHDKAKGKPKVTGRKGKRTPSDEESLLF